MKKEKKGIGIAWYQKEQWSLLKETAFDKEDIEDTYDEWKLQADKKIKQMRRQGLHIIKVSFDVHAFNAWCLKKGKIPDGQSRAEYTVNWLQENNK